MQKVKQLPPIKGVYSEWDVIEKNLKDLFLREIYLPLIKELGEPKKTIKNAINYLWEALRSGRVTYSHGTFSGQFNAGVSKELKQAGAKWDRKSESFKLSQDKMTLDMRNMVSSTESRFQQKIDKIDQKLAQILPEELADKFTCSKSFDKALWKTEKSFQANVRNISFAPAITDKQRKKIAVKWQNNMRLYIKDFTKYQIVELRKNLQASVFAGNRYEAAVKTIKKSYGVSENKAKFLARQETKLLITKYQEIRYSAAGIKKYTWHSVAGTPAHPVRPRHKALADASKAGKIYNYDDPPVTSEPGQPERRNNPGQDYNCRCFSRPIVKFKK